MTTDRQIVFAFLKVAESLATIDRKHLEQIRSAYITLTKNVVSSTTTTTTNPDDQLKLLAQMFMLVSDSTNLGHLNLCVTSSIACEAILGKYIHTLIVEKRNARKKNQLSTTATKQMTQASSIPIAIESIAQATCQIFIKQNQPAVIDFIQNFLSSPLNQTKSTQRSNDKMSYSSNDLSINKRLIQGCTLDIFIRHQLVARGGVIDIGHPISKLPLVDSITLVDEFDTWHFDHLHGLFDLNLMLENQIFPCRWQLASDAQLFYRINAIDEVRNNDGQNQPMIRNVDRPSIASLERFVEDVCEKENNGLAAKWIDALRADDIFTFDHLANSKYTEWIDLKVLSINGKKILKSYVDPEKQMTTDVKSSQNHSHKSLEIIQSDCNYLQIFIK